MAKIKQYRPIQGDTWEKLSYKIYGNSGHVRELIEHNPQMRMIEYFDGGEVVSYPKLSESENAALNLPPWR